MTSPLGLLNPINKEGIREYQPSAVSRVGDSLIGLVRHKSNYLWIYQFGDPVHF